MTPSKLAVPVLGAALIASVIAVVVMLVSPVMAQSEHVDGTCGSLGGLILRGGETRNNGGEISAEQFDARVSDCRSATIGHAALLLVPLGAGAASWWGAMTISGRERRE